MTETRYYFGLAAMFACFAAVSVAGVWVAQVAGSNWILLPVGCVAVMVTYRLFGSFWAPAVKAGHRDPFKRSHFSMRTRLLTLVGCLVLIAFELWTGIVSAGGTLIIGGLLGQVISPMPHDPEVITDE